MVIKLPLRDLEDFKESMRNIAGDQRMIYQKTSLGNLFISEQKPDPAEKKNVTSR